MKIGIITFHWATNYGAILQAYALQTYLEEQGNETVIINYRPKEYNKSLLKCFLTLRFWNYLSNLREYFKEQKLEKFRKKYLNETKLYDSLDKLQNNPPDLDVYVCGSDQIWNPSFTQFGEGKPTPVYFLNFGNENIKRIAYAASFGTENYPKAASIIAQKYIHNFNAISVREKSGLNILKQLGFEEAINLPDPTLLLNKGNYSFAASKLKNVQKNAFFYILRNENNCVVAIKEQLKNSYRITSATDSFIQPSVENWVNTIKNSSLVITNSYHGMIFSLIFHVPFIIILARGASSGMNDRFKTLLNELNLDYRAINNFNSNEFNKIVNEKIDWQKIDDKLENIKLKSDLFFSKLSS